MSIPNRTETDMGDPLRITSKDQLRNYGPEGKERLIDVARIVSGARVIGGAENTSINDAGAELTIRSLENATKHGTLYDSATVMLGLQQVARYTPSKEDNAVRLMETIAGVASSSPKEYKVKVCNFDKNCIDKSITEEEFGSVIGAVIPITKDMNSHRSVYVGTGMSAVATYIAVTNRPQLVTGEGKLPKDILAEDEKKSPTVVKDTRTAMRTCIRQDSPQFDLSACSKIAARAAIYNLAAHNLTFTEQDPAYLVPQPDLPPMTKEELLALDKSRK